MNCPNCGSEIGLTPRSMCIDKSSRKQNYCWKCMRCFSDEEIQNMKDIDMIEEDIQIWKKSKNMEKNE